MILPENPENEKARLNALQSLNILDSLPEQQYDNITELASYICGTRNAVISLVDKNRQWFKSKVGISACETSREVSFCAHAIHNPTELMEISDTSSDLRFKDNPLVLDKENPVIFYAGVPILDTSGHALGTLCVMDDQPKKLDEKQKKALYNLAQQVQELLKLHVLNNELKESRSHLKKHNELLKDFAGTVSHDMKMPLANLIVTSDILKKKYAELIDDNGKIYLNYLKKSSLSLSNYITDILAHYESSSYNIDDRKSFDVNDLLENIIELINIKHDCEINLPEFNHTLHCNRVALEQIFLNLIGNSIKYNDKEKAVIDLSISLDATHYIFKITDNGRGIPKDKIESIFDLFSTVGEYDREGQKGHGIGLCTVKKLVHQLGGEISVASELGSYTTFNFSIAQ